MTGLIGVLPTDCARFKLLAISSASCATIVDATLVVAVVALCANADAHLGSNPVCTDSAVVADADPRRPTCRIFGGRPRRRPGSILLGSRIVTAILGGNPMYMLRIISNPAVAWNTTDIECPTVGMVSTQPHTAITLRLVGRCTVVGPLRSNWRFAPPGLMTIVGRIAVLRRPDRLESEWS